MEYGIFSEPSFNWALIGASIFCAIFFLALIALLFTIESITIWVGRGHRKQYEAKRAIFESRAAPTKGLLLKILEQVNKSDVAGVVTGILIFCSFIAIWPLLGVGLWQGSYHSDRSDPSDCSGQEYASQGAYQVIDARIMFDYEKKNVLVEKDDPILKDEGKKYTRSGYGNLQILDKSTGTYDYLYTYKPGRPKYYEVKLSGRSDSSQPSNFGVIRCVKIPYAQVAENVKFTPTVEEIQATTTPPPTIVELPKLAVKSGDKWWKFSDTTP